MSTTSTPFSRGVRSPRTNGFCERFRGTLKEEFFSVASRKKTYGSLQELQDDLDSWLRFYNAGRSHQGCRDAQANAVAGISRMV